MPAAIAGLVIGALVGWLRRDRTADQDADTWRPYAHRDMNDHRPGVN